MKLFRTTGGIFVQENEHHYLVADRAWDELLSRDDLPEFLEGFVGRARPLAGFREGEVLAPDIDALSAAIREGKLDAWRG